MIGEGEFDPVKYVDDRFLAVLGTEPDAAAHFYWSDLLIVAKRCPVPESVEAELDNYLSQSPQETFSITGQVSNEDGDSMPGVQVSLTGSQQVSTLTDANGIYLFEGLPTSGSYLITPTKNHYTFSAASKSFLNWSGEDR